MTAKMPMYRQKVGASRFCNAVYMPLKKYDCSTLSRTEAIASSRTSSTVSSGRHPSSPRGEK